LFDDDLYEPNFLQTAYECLLESGFPPGFFSSFRMMQETEQFQPRTVPYRTIRKFTGREFLGRYSARRPDVVSTCGLFDTTTIRNIVGGVEELCASAIGVYCEYLFLVRCALLDRIVYVDAPLVLFRIHAASWSENPSEYAKYVESGKELVRKCSEVLRHPALVVEFDKNLMMICEQHLITIAHRAAKLETERKNFGLFAIWRAISKCRNEIINTKENFFNQGGKSSKFTKLGFAKIEIYCYRIIVLVFSSCFYRSYMTTNRD
jgi:hypothetical protein